MSQELKTLAERLVKASQAANQAATVFGERGATIAAEAAAIQAEVVKRAAAGVRVTAGPSALSMRRIAVLELHATTHSECTRSTLEANRELASVALAALGHAEALQRHINDLNAYIEANQQQGGQ
jgi:hypothetical protein